MRVSLKVLSIRIVRAWSVQTRICEIVSLLNIMMIKSISRLMDFLLNHIKTVFSLTLIINWRQITSNRNKRIVLQICEMNN
jgi:hypothetical protein